MIQKPFLACLLLALVFCAPAWAWGGTGHRYIGELAVAEFPQEIPAFLRTPAGGHPDRPSGAGAGYFAQCRPAA